MGHYLGEMEGYANDPKVEKGPELTREQRIEKMTQEIVARKKAEKNKPKEKSIFTVAAEEVDKKFKYLLDFHKEEAEAEQRAAIIMGETTLEEIENKKTINKFIAQANPKEFKLLAEFCQKLQKQKNK